MIKLGARCSQLESSIRCHIYHIQCSNTTLYGIHRVLSGFDEMNVVSMSSADWFAAPVGSMYVSYSDAVHNQPSPMVL